MDRQQFFKELKFALRRHEYRDVEAIIEYYEEIIMERRECGETEDEIIASFDTVDKIAANFEREAYKVEKRKEVETAVGKVVEQPTAKNYSKVVLIACTLPITLPLAIILGVVVLIIAIATFIIALSMWVVCISLVGSGAAVVIAGIIGGALSGAWLLVIGSIGGGLIVFSLGMFAIGLTVHLTKGVLKVSARMLRGVVKLFSGKQKTGVQANEAN